MQLHTRSSHTRIYSAWVTNDLLLLTGKESLEEFTHSLPGVFEQGKTQTCKQN